MRRVVVSAVTAIIGFALVVVAAVLDPVGAAYGSLAAASFGICVGWGALLVLMMGLASRANWVAAYRKLLEAMVASLWVPSLGIVILLAFGGQLYPWMDGGLSLEPYEEHVIRLTAPWHSRWLLYLRSIVYLTVPLVLGELLLRMSRRLDKARNTVLDLRRSRLSVAGLVLVILLGSFAAFDWFMALEPAWVSTMYGLAWLSSGFVTAFAVLSILVWLVKRRGGLGALSWEQEHRFGKLLFTAVCVWAYLTFAQFLVVWIGDLPSEVRYYVRRTEGPWEAVAIALMVFGFAVPFVALMPVNVKRTPGPRAVVATCLILVHALEHGWLVLPARRDVAVSWAVVPAFVAICAGAVALGMLRADRHVDRLPRTDPLMASNPARPR